MQSQGTLEAPHPKLRAAGATTAATIVYIGVALSGVRLLDISPALHWLTAHEAAVVSGFMVGSIGQIAALVLIWLAVRPGDLKRALESLRLASSTEGWLISVTVIAVETVVLYGFFLDVGWQALEPSALNLTGSMAPLLDGVTQEVFFRGYLILRLARGGFGPLTQLLLSSLAFSAIHVGYMGEGWSSALPTLFGTVGLGLALGWAFIRSGYSLRPPIVAHVAILLIVQPWLALSR
jgi:hypothetical protein